ncbi:MAG: DUF402 domain-containing protein [Aggregatilineales bacterium]
MNAITVVKNDHEGRFVWQYQGELVARGETWVCLSARFNRDYADIGPAAFRRGDRFVEWFYSDRWYNVFQVFSVDDGHLRGWYCNITRPAVIQASVVASDDLALDVFVAPDGTVHLLDEDEFAALELAAEERAQALDAVETIRAAVAVGSPPFERARMR